MASGGLLPRTFVTVCGIIVASLCLPAACIDETTGTVTHEVDSTVKNCVELISVSRVSIKQGYAVTLRFTKNEDNLTYLRSDSRSKDASVNVTEEGEGVWVATFSIDNFGETASYGFPQGLQIGCFENSYIMDIAIESRKYASNRDEIPEAEHFSDIPSLEVKPAKEAVYNPDEDIYVTATVHGKSINDTVPEAMIFPVGVDLEDGKPNYFIGDKGLVKEKNTTHSQGKAITRATLATSSIPMAGYLLASVFKAGEKTEGLVSSVTLSRYIPVRPSNQSGVWPDGYLAVMKSPGHAQTSEAGNVLTICPVHYQCMQRCSFLGEAILEIKVYQVHADGSLEDVPSVQVSETVPALKTVSWVFNSEVALSDREATTTYMCQARDVTHNKTVSRLLDATAKIMQYIDEERSSVSVESNGVGVNPTLTVTLNCAYVGEVRSPVSIWFKSPFFKTDIDSSTSIGPDSTMYTKVVTLSLEAYEWSYYHGMVAQRGIYCHFFSAYKRGSVEYYFEIPDPQNYKI